MITINYTRHELEKLTKGDLIELVLIMQETRKKIMEYASTINDNILSIKNDINKIENSPE